MEQVIDHSIMALLLVVNHEYLLIYAYSRPKRPFNTWCHPAYCVLEVDGVMNINLQFATFMSLVGCVRT